MTGTLVNLATVLAGSTAGLLLGRRLPERVATACMQAVGAVTLAVGIKMVLGASTPITTVLISLCLGAVLGELADIEGRLERLGRRLEAVFGQGRRGNFTQGFMTASLLYCVGPMTVLGCLQDGLRGDPSILITKATMDGISSVALAAALGFGVLCSAATILAYQGSLTLLASQLGGLLTDPVVDGLTATGGLLIVCLAFNIWGIARLRVTNMLPALVVVTLILSL